MTRLTRILTVLAVVATVGMITLLAGGPAYAADDATPDRVKAEVTRRIDLRLAALSRFDASVIGAKHLTNAHESTLKDLIWADRKGLTDLKAKVARETTLTALRGDAKSMVDDYRIFMLAGPKVRLTRVGDAEQASITKLTTLHGKLADLVAKAEAAGEDTTAAEQDLVDMKAAIDKAAADIDGKVAELLAIQAGPDGAGIRAQVAGVQAALSSGRADLVSAVAEAKRVRDFLKK